MRIIACMVAIFAVFAGSVSAQDTFVTEKVAVGYEEVITKKSNHLIVLDIPVMSTRRTVDVNRILDSSIYLGTVLSPWEAEVSFLSFAPEFSYFSRNIHLGVSGGTSEAKDAGITRKVKFSEGRIEGSLWLFLVGGDVFEEKEENLNMSTGPQFTSNFSRKSSGSRGWAGIKLGDFKTNFIALRYGRGHAKTKGVNTYSSPTLSDLEAISLYDEKFKNKTFSAEIKISYKRMTGGVLVERGSYGRVLHSPDPLLYGWNDFSEHKVVSTFEFIPLPRKDFARLLVKGTKFSGNRDTLLFRNQSPELQILLRLKFK